MWNQYQAYYGKRQCWEKSHHPDHQVFLSGGAAGASRRAAQGLCYSFTLGGKMEKKIVGAGEHGSAGHCRGWGPQHLYNKVAQGTTAEPGASSSENHSPQKLKSLYSTQSL